MAFKDDNEMIESTNYQDINNDLGVDTINKVQGIDTVNKVNSEQPKSYTYKTRTYASAQAEDDAKNKAQLDLSLGVEHVLDDQETEDYVSTKELYEKNLGVTQYDELRTKLHLKDDESFTDYYNRTHYVPEGFEMQAKLLLAEEKRKKLYAEVEAGNMSEEDFLYEAYVKDLLKQDGVDFSSPLYWYQRYKNKEYDDPRDNATFMLQLIEEARTLFQAETWYEALSKATASDTFAAYVTGDELTTKEIETIFADQFEELTQYYESSEQIIKFYRAGMLQGFNPTIDYNGDGKVDYYLAPNGKLYNVNETGEGANTMRAYYDDNGNLIRIVASDSGAGEIVGESLKGIARFFTDVVDLVPTMIGAVVDIFDGDGYGSTLADWSATMSSFWNETAIGDIDYIAQSGWKTSDGDSNGVVIGRQAGRLVGTILSFIATTALTYGVGTAANAASKAATSAAAGTAKRAALKAVSGTLKYGVGTALRLTTWSNGAGSGSGLKATTKALIPVFIKDATQNISTLAVNQKRFGLSDAEVVAKGLGGATINFGVSLALRSVVDDGAVRRWSKTFSKTLTTAQQNAVLMNRSGQYISSEVLKAAGITTGQRIANKLYTGVGEHIAIGLANMGMDTVENILTAWSQTSLSTSGELYSGEALKNLFNNPQFMMNLVWQAGMNAKDEFSLKKNDIIGLGADVARMGAEFRQFINTKIAEADNEADIRAYRELLIAYDTRLKEIIDTGTTIDASGKEVKMTRAEAEIKTLNEFTSNLGLDANSELFQKWGKYTKDALSEQALLATEMQFQQANEIIKAYNRFGTNVFKRGISQMFYGKSFKNMSDLLIKGFTKTYLASGLRTTDINEQLRQDTEFGRIEVYSDLYGKLSDMGDTIIDKEIEVLAATQEYETITTKSGKTRRIPHTIREALSKTGLDSYMNKLSELNELDKANAYQSFLFKIPSDGSALDSAETQSDATKYMSVLHSMITSLNDGEERILFKLSDTEYLLQFTGLGNTTLDIEQARLFIKAMANLKHSLNSSTARTNTAEAIQIVFQTFFSDRTKASRAIQDNPDLVPLFIETIVNNKSFSIKEASKMLASIEETYGTKIKLPASGDTTNTLYNKAVLLKSFLPRYDEISEILQKDPSEITSKDKIKIKRFTYEFPKESEAVQTAIDPAYKIIKETDYNKLLNLNFQNGQIENSLKAKSQEIDSSLKLISSDSNTEDTYEGEFNNFIQDTFSSEVDPLETLTVKKGSKGTKQTSIQSLNRYEDFRGSLSDHNAKILDKYYNKKDVTMTLNQLSKHLENALAKGEINQSTQTIITNTYKKYSANVINGLLDYFDTEDKSLARKLVGLYVPEAVEESLLDNMNIGELLSDANVELKDAKNYILKHPTRTVMDTAWKIAEDNYAAIHKHQVQLPPSKVITVTFTNLTSDIERSVDRKLLNNSVARRAVQKQSTKNIINELFDGDYAKYYTWNSHRELKNKLIEQYGTGPVDFPLTMINGRLTNTELDDITKKLNISLNKFIYQPDTIQPGLTFNDNTYGIKFSSDADKTLTSLNNIIDTEVSAGVQTTEEFKYDNVLNAITTLSSGINYIDENTSLNYTDIPQVFISAKDLEFAMGASAIDVPSELKQGKAASWAKKKTLSHIFSGLVAQGKVNQELKTPMFVKDIINIVAELYDKNNKKYRTDMVFEKLTKAQKDSLKELYTVKSQGNKTYVSYKYNTPEEFRTAAYELIKNQGLKDLNQILPTYNLTVDQHNRLIRPGMGKAEFAGAYAPIHWFDENAIGLYSDEYTAQMFKDFPGMRPYDLSEEAKTEALNYVNDKNLLTLETNESNNDPNIPQNNIYYELLLNATRVNNLLSDTELKGLNSYNLPIESKRLLTILGNADNRANFAVAVSKSLKNTDFIGTKLNVTPELLNRIKSNYSDVYTNKQTGKHTIYASTEPSVDIAMGSDFNPMRVIPDLNTDNIKTILELLDLSKYSFVSKRILNDSLPMHLYSLISTSDNNAYISYRSLYSLTKTEIDRLLSDTSILRNILDPKDLSSVLETLQAIRNSKAIIDDSYKDTPYIKRAQPEKISPTSSDEPGTIIDNTPEAIKEAIENSAYIDYLERRALRSNAESNYIKITQVSDPKYRQNKLMAKILKDLRLYATPNVSYTGSIMMQNMNYHENMIAFKHNIVNYAKAFNNLYPEINPKAAINLAYHAYLYSSGIEMQREHPDFLLAHGKTGEPIEVTLSGTYYDDSVNTLGVLKNKYLDPDTLSLKNEYSDVIMIKLDRNMLDTTYSDSIAELKIYPLKTNEGKIKDLLFQRARSVLEYQGLEKASPEEQRAAIDNYYFKAQVSTQRNFVEQLKAANTNKLIDDDSLIDLYANISGMSFTSQRRTLREEVLYQYTKPIGEVGNYYKTNDTTLKLQEISAHGITKDSLYKQDNVQESIQVINNKLEDIIDSNTNLNKTYVNRSKALVQAMLENNTELKETLFHAIRTNKNFNTPELLEEAALNVIARYVIDSPSLDMDILKLSGNAKEIESNFKQIQDPNIRINYSEDSNIRSLSELRAADTMGLDIESFYDAKGRSYPFQIAIIDAEGKEHTIYLKVDGINTPQDIIDNFPSFTRTYWKNANGTIINQGMDNAIAGYFKQMEKGENRQELYDILDRALKQRLDKKDLPLLKDIYIVGYNSTKFDLRILTEGPNPIIDKVKYAELLANHMDSNTISQESPTYKTIDIFGGKSTLENISKQHDIDLTDAHNGVDDARATLKLNKALLDDIVDSNAYMSRSYKDLHEIYTQITGKDSSAEAFEWLQNILNTKDIRKSVTEVDPSIINDINIRHKDPDRLKNIQKILNIMKTKTSTSTADARNKALRKALDQHRTQSQMRFAHTFQSKKYSNDLTTILSYLTREALSDTDIDNALRDIASKISASSQLDDILDILTNNASDLYGLFEVDKQEVAKFAAENPNHKTDLNSKLNTAFGDDVLLKEDEASSAYAYISATKVFDNYINKLPVDSNAKRYMKELLMRLFDGTLDEEGKIPKVSADSVIDMLSNFDKDTIEWLTTDPIINTKFNSLYEKAQTVVGKKIKLQNGNLTYLQSDTFYMTPERFCELFGVTEDLKLTPEDLAKTYGDENGTIILPALRHPADRQHSFNGLRIEILDPRAVENRGLTTAINIDTYRQFFNGDFDGDATVLLRPQKEFSQYFSKIIDATYAPNKLLDSAMEKVYDNINYESHSDIIAENRINNYKKLNDRISQDQQYLTNMTSGNILEEYQSRKNKFIDDYLKPISKLYAIEEDKTRDILSAMYLKEPIDISDTLQIKTKNRFIVYSDSTGLLHDSLNIKAKRAYMLHQLAYWDVLNYKDTVTGMFQKGFLTEDLSKYGAIDFETQAFLLSSTTRSILNNNLTDDFKTALIDGISKSEHLTTSENAKIAKIISNATSAEDIEQAMRLLQILSKDNYNTLVTKAISEIPDDTPYRRAYKSFINPIKEDIWFSNIDKITNILHNITGDIFKKNSTFYDDGINYIKSIANYNEADNVIKYTDLDNKDISKVAKKVTVSYMVDDFTIIPEDTFVALEGMDKLTGINFASSDNLPESILKYFDSYETGQQITDPKLLRALGIPINAPYNIFYAKTANNSVLYGRGFGLEDQKLYTPGDNASKATGTKMLTSEELPEDVRSFTSNSVMIRSVSGTSISKLTSLLDSKNLSYTVLLKDGKTKQKLELKDIRDNNIRMINVDEAISLLEANKTWDKTYSTTSFEQLAYGNNMLSAPGIGMIHGVFCKVDPKTKQILTEMDNSAYANMTSKIGDHLTPARYHRNSLEILQDLQVSSLISHMDIEKFNELYDTSFTSHAESIDYILDRYNEGIDLQSEIKRLKQNVKHFIPNEFESALFSSELMQKFGKGRLTEGNQDIVQANKKPTELQHSSKSLAKSSITGKIMTLDDHIDLTTEGAYLSTIDFINYMNSKLNTKSFLSGDRARKLEEYDMLLNGLIEPKTRQEISNINTKYQNSIDNPILKTYGPTAAMDTRKDKGFKYWDKFNKADNASGHAPGVIKADGTRPYKLDDYIDYSTGKFVSPGGKHQSSRRMAIALKAILESDNSDIGIAQRLDPKHQQAQLAISNAYYAYDRDTQRIQLKPIRQYEGKVTVEQANKIIFKESTSQDYHRQQEEFAKKSAPSTETMLRSNPSNFIDLDEHNINSQIESLIKDGGIERSGQLTELQQKYLNAYETYHMPETMEEVIKVRNEYFSGNIGESATIFKTKPLGLNNGLALDSPEALMHDRNMHQIRVTEQAMRNFYESDIVRLNKLATESGCDNEIQRYAYILGLLNEKQVAEEVLLKSKNKDTNAKMISENIDKTFKELQIEDARKYLKSFEKQHGQVCQELHTILKKLNKDASKYSNLMDEPTNNIFFALLPRTRSTTIAREAGAKYLINMISLGQLNYYKDIPGYAGYNLYTSLGETINAVARQSAIYENSVRLKQSGTIDSIKVQDLLTETISTHFDTISQWDTEQDGETKKHLTTLEMLASNISEDIKDASLDASIRLALEEALPNSEGRRNIPLGEAYLTIYSALNDFLEKQPYSLSEASSLLNTATSKTDRDAALRIVYAHERRQDIFAELDHLSKNKLATDLYNSIKHFTEINNLSIVDKYGRLLSQDTYYKLSPGSLEYVSGVVQAELNGFDKSIVEKAIAGDLFLMDKTLAETYAKQVFVKEVPTKLRKIVQKTSNWCVKMLMSSPFKIIDRMLKFTMFDFTTLSSANHRTAFKNSEALIDLRQYFGSKGVVISDNLKEFLNTQGAGIGTSTIDMLSTGDTSMATKHRIGQSYFDFINERFSEQTLSQRYAYWLATKEALAQDNPDYSVLGSAYHLKDKIAGMDAVLDSNGNEKVTKAGNQAAFAMSQMLGSPNDFPSAASTLNRYGMVFTTFPLAAMRWGVGELRSVASAFKDIFSEGSTRQGIKWLVRNSAGIAGTFILEQVLITLICDIFGIDDEREEEWKEKGALPNVTQTIIQGEPIMDTFSSMNISRELYSLTLEPFINKDDNESGDIASGAGRYFSKNILSHINPIAKNAIETVSKKDFIDDQIIDTSEKYNMFENIGRKASSYILGAAGANALFNQISRGESDSLITNILTGAQNAIAAEMGNTKAYKENNKNYYKMLSLVNTYKYKDTVSTGTASTEYSSIKSEIYTLINNKATPAKVYEKITSMLNQGYDPYTIRNALNACSLESKLDSLSSIEDFLSTLSDTDKQNIKTALAYERKVYSWLDEYSDSITDSLTSSSYNKYSNNCRYSDYMPSNYYSNYTPQTYTTFNSNYNTSTNYKNPFYTYNNMVDNIEYQRQQAEYARQRKQWEDN